MKDITNEKFSGEGSLLRDFRKEKNPGYVEYILDKLDTYIPQQSPEALQGDDYLMEMLYREKRRIENMVTPPRIREKLDTYVIGQDNAKKSLSVAIFNHLIRIHSKHPDNIQKSNILLVGPTGTGKTLLAKTLAKIIDVPFVIADATAFSPTGFVGTNVNSIILRLFQEANGNAKRAEQGIVYIDEIDKLRVTGDPNRGAKDGQAEGVQQALLKLIEGTDIQLVSNKLGKAVHINTGNILFICGGAFPDLLDKEKVTRSIGFGAKQDAKLLPEKELLDKLFSYGMIPEFMGRLPVIVQLEQLSKQDLRRILTEPKNSLVEQYKNLFAEQNVTLCIEESVLDTVAEKAYSKGLGARGLRSLMEEFMQDVVYNFPYLNDEANVCLITKESMITKQARIYHREEEEQVACHLLGH